MWLTAKQVLDPLKNQRKRKSFPGFSEGTSAVISVARIPSVELSWMKFEGTLIWYGRLKYFRHLPFFELFEIYLGSLPFISEKAKRKIRSVFRFMVIIKWKNPLFREAELAIMLREMFPLYTFIKILQYDVVDKCSVHIMYATYGFPLAGTNLLRFM